jgi:superfamily II DNA or RNA helicase
MAQEGVTKFTVEDERTSFAEFGEIPKKVLGYEGRDWQIAAATNFINGSLLGVPFKRGIVNAATNSGKSWLFPALHKAKLSSGRTTILIDEKEIFTQLLDDGSKADFEVGYIHRKTVKVGDYNVLMYKSALNRLEDSPEAVDLVKNTDFLIVDECHTSGAAKYRKLVSAFENAESRLFVSGTALEQYSKVNAWRVVGQSGSVIKNVRNKEMIDKGFSLKPTIKIKTIYEEQLVEDYRSDYRLNVVFNPERADFIKDVCANKDRHILIAVYEHEHGEFLQSYIPNSVYMPGEHPDRDEIVDQFKKGEIRVLITTVLRKGVNIPIMNTLILAMGRKSTVDIKQWIGRTLRTNDKDDQVEVFDFLDSGKYTSRHSQMRIALYESEEFEIEYLD